MSISLDLEVAPLFGIELDWPTLWPDDPNESRRFVQLDGRRSGSGPPLTTRRVVIDSFAFPYLSPYILTYGHALDAEQPRDFPPHLLPDGLVLLARTALAGLSVK